MTIITAFLASKIGIYVAGIVVAIIAFVGTYLRGKHTGAAAERTNQRAKEADAYEKHLQDIADAANARPSGELSRDPNNRDNR